MRPVLQADRARAQEVSRTRCGFHVVRSIVDGRPIQVWCGPYADAAVLDHVHASWHAKVVRRAWELLLVAQAQYLDECGTPSTTRSTGPTMRSSTA
jgi:hypothetical protein